MNKVTKNKQLDVHVRYWVRNCVVSRYYNSVFLGHAKAEDMISHFGSAISGISELRNLLQLSMDGPSVNWKFHRMFCDQLTNDFAAMLIDIGSCGLHVIHGGFKDGELASDFEVSKTLSSAHKLFDDTPARREDYVTVTQSTVFPEKLCNHRWLENLPAALRMLEILPNLKKYVNAAENKQVAKPGSNKYPHLSYEQVKKAVGNPLFKAQLQFYIEMARKLTPFLTKYQSDFPLVSFIAKDLGNIFCNILSIFIKERKVEPIRAHISRISQLDFDDESLHLSHTKIQIGIVTQSELEKTKSSDREKMEFRMSCKQFAIKVVSKIAEKSPLKYLLVRSARCLDPTEMVKDKEKCKERMAHVLPIMHNNKKWEMQHVQATADEYKAFLANEVVSHREEFSSFSHQRGDRLDQFFHRFLATKEEYSNLWRVVKVILTLSHGQAGVERGFSINKELARDNMDEATFVTSRQVKDKIISVGSDPLNVPITPALLTSVGSAYRKHREHVEAEEAKKSSSAKSKQKEEMQMDIVKLQEKELRLKAEAKKLEKDVDDASNRAEVERDVALVAASNAL